MNTGIITWGIVLAFVAISFILGLTFTILTFLRVKPQGDASRSKATAWLKATWCIFLLHVIFHLALLLMGIAPPALDWTAYNTTISQLSLMSTLFGAVGLAMVLVVQVELALGVRAVSGTSSHLQGGRRSKARLAAHVGLGFVTLLTIIRFIAAQYIQSASREMSYDYDPSGTVQRLATMTRVFNFIIYLVLFAGAAATLIYTVVHTRHTPLQKVYSFLLAMNILTVLRELYNVIYAGIFSLGPAITFGFGWNYESLIALDTLKALFHPTTTVVVLILAWAALKRKEGGIWLNGVPAKGGDIEGRSPSFSTVRRS